MTTHELLINAKNSCRLFDSLSPEEINKVLTDMADCLEAQAGNIVSANKIDIENAKGTISDVMIDRLTLDIDRIKGMADGMRAVAALKSPVGEVITEKNALNGMNIKKVRVPIGVIAIIYESRPNVTSDAVSLCFKSSNVCVLRGGKEAINTNKAVIKALQKGLKLNSLPTTLINLVEDTTRQSSTELMTAVGLVDLLIPRGGHGLINACVENARVPCIQTGTGICHIYVDKYADFDKALNIIDNAKTSRPSVCNAAEVCVVDKAVAEEFLPLLYKRIVTDRANDNKTPCSLVLDDTAFKIIDGTKADENSFDTEFLDYKMAVRVIDGVDKAILHINAHSTGHSEAIITENAENAEKFTNAIDSAAVYVNASTRFTDGGEFGLGCEMGISTQKLHARGPMGLEELTSYKYIITGNGQIRS